MLPQRLKLLERLVALLLHRRVRHQMGVGLLAGNPFLNGTDRSARRFLQRLQRGGPNLLAACRNQLVAERQLAAQLLTLAGAEILLQRASLRHHHVNLFSQLLVGRLQLRFLALLNLAKLLLQRLLAHGNQRTNFTLTSAGCLVNLRLQ